MSMLFDLRRVSKEQAESLVNDPSDVFFFLHGDEPYKPLKGFFSKLLDLKPTQKQKRAWDSPPEGTVLGLDKNWHVIHYLFSRTPWEGPLPQASLLSGSELGRVNVGYGPARILTPQQIEAFRDFLDALDKDKYASGVTGTELEQNQIYGAYPEWSQEDANYLWEYVEALKSFFSNAKANEEYIVMYLY